MSVQLIAWAYEQRVGSPSRKAVLIALANRANHDTGRCTPLIENIAKETELGISTVRQAIKDMCEAGIIGRERIRRHDGSYSGYAYTFPAAGSPPPAAGASPPPAADGLEPEETLEPSAVANATAAATPGNAHDLVASFVDASRESGADPPRRVIGQLAKEVKKLLEEGASEKELTAALDRLRERSLHPSSLASVLFDVRQRGGPSENGRNVLDVFLAKHDGQWPTGTRLVRGQGGVTFVHDPLGYDKPNHAVPWGRPNRDEIVQALKGVP